MEKPNLKNRVALITGASGGIGRAVAERLGQAGMRLALCGRSLDKLKQTERAARAAGAAGVLLLPGDLTAPGYIGDCLENVQRAFGELCVLVNNAGIAQSGPFEAIDEALFDRVMALNVKAPFFFCQKALPLLMASGLGAIVNIGSVVSHKGYPLQGAYAASKHALLGFSKTLANEYFEKNVRVHVICPGGVYTDMAKLARPDLSPDGLIDPKEIAEIAAFLLENRGNAVVDEICVHRVGKAPFQ